MASISASPPIRFGAEGAPIDFPVLCLGFVACSITAALSVMLVAAVPALLAIRKAALALERLAEVAREEVPGTMAAVRLSGMEMSDLSMELSDLSQEISQGIRNSARAVRLAEDGLRRVGSLAASRTAAIIEERAVVPVPSVTPVIASAARSTKNAIRGARDVVSQPSTVPLPGAAETETKAAPSGPTPFPHFATPAAAPVPFGHIPPYPAAAAAGWWAPFATFPSHMLLAHSPAAGQAQQQAMGAQQRLFVPNAPPWFCFGPPPFLSPARPALLAPGGPASDVNMEINKSLMAASKPSLSGDGSRSRVLSSVATKATVKRSPSAKLAAKPVEVLPRERLPSGFRPWKAASRSSGSNDTSALLSSNGATTTCSAAVEAFASSRQAVSFALKPCSQGTEGLQKVKAGGQPIRPAAQQPGALAGPVNAVNPVNAVTPVNTNSPMGHLQTPLRILPAISPIPSFHSAAADQARAYACTMGVVGDKRRLGRAEGAAAGSVDVQGKRKKRQKHGGVGSEVVEGPAALRMNGKSGEMEGECGRSKEQEEEERSKDNEKEREKEKACRNCGTHTTPFWRKDRSGSGQHLCNACGLYLAKNDAPRPSVLWKKDSQGTPDNTSPVVAAKA
ncbi:unnamed protein product [Closterium sp. NIES-64]|nr:unnamed protein product [Closterium sp. NIES-64]